MKLLTRMSFFNLRVLLRLLQILQFFLNFIPCSYNLPDLRVFKILPVFINKIRQTPNP